MKQLIYIILFIAAGFTSCSAGSQQEERRLRHFDKVKASGSFHVFLRQGDEEKAYIEVGAGDISMIKTEVDGTTLKIYADGSGWWRNLFFDNVRIYVTFRELHEVEASGSGLVKVESPLSGQTLRLSSSGSGRLVCEGELASQGDVRISNSGSGSCRIHSSIATQSGVRITNSGSGSVVIEELNAEQADINNSGSGGLTINGGYVNKQNVVMSGSGGLRLKQSSALSHVKKSGSGSIHIDVRERLTGHSAGSGNVYLRGAGAQLDFNISGSGRVRHVE